MKQKATETDVAELHGKINTLFVKVANTLLEGLDSEDKDDVMISVS